MRWLIVEDALKNRKGHWLEAVTAFHQGFRELGDEVTVLADAEVEPEISEPIGAIPILPPSIWHRLGDGAGPLTRYSRVFVHAWQTWRVMQRYLSKHPEVDVIFVPTVGLHHLIAWAWLIKRQLRRSRARVLLFFIHAPLRYDAAAKAVMSDGSPTSRAMARLLRWLAPEIRTGKVVLGLETRAMQAGMQKLAGVPFVRFPIPVAALNIRKPARAGGGGPIEMACFGPARAEKGSDILQRGILHYRRRNPASRIRFTVHWVEDFMAEGARVSKLPELMKDPQMTYLTRYLLDAEYAGQLVRTDVMLLPYRLSSYAFRGSKVAAEAAVSGIPAIVTEGSTLAEVVDEFGVGLTCADGDPESLAAAIDAAGIGFEKLSAQARARQAASMRYFSVSEFRSVFCGQRLSTELPTNTDAACRQKIFSSHQGSEVA